MNQPFIVSAATIYHYQNGSEMICSPRHYDKTVHPLLDRISESYGHSHFSEEQGFVDQFGKFYNRIDAWTIAETNGQIIRRVGGDVTSAGTGRLFSENLY